MFKTAYLLFLTVLMFAPLAFGTVEVWSYTIMELLICISAIFFFLSYRQNKFYQVPGIIPLLFVCGAILFQAIPVPAMLVQLISPESHQIFQNSIGVFSKINWMTISIHPKSTLSTFFCFSSYVLFYVTAIQLLSKPELLKKTLAIIAGFAAVLAIFVIFEFFTKILNYPLPHEKILFLRPSLNGEGAVGPYVNRNHYAALMEMIFPLMLGLFLFYRPLVKKSTFKKQLQDFLLEKRIHSHLLYGTVAVLTAASLFVTLSRGGILSLTISMGVFAWFLYQKTGQKKPVLFVCIIFILVFSLTGTDTWNLIFERFGNIRDDSGAIATGRPVYWADTIKIAAAFPLFGAGAGTFEHIYPTYRTFPGNSLLEHAHNDYLEFLATGGLFISALMLFALVSIVYPAFQRYRKRREMLAKYLFTGCLAAILSILLHSVVEFNMQIGANGLYFFFVLAVSVSAAHTRFGSSQKTTYLKQSTVKFHIPLLAAICLAAGVLYFNFGALLGNYYFSDYQRVNIDNRMSSEKQSLLFSAAQKAASVDSTNPAYLYILAKISEMTDQNQAAENYFKKTLRLAPLNSLYLQDAGYFLSNQGAPLAADKLISAGISYDPHNPQTYFNYASWLFQEHQVEQGLDTLRLVMEMKPDTTNDSLAVMVWAGLNEKQMLAALPDRVQPNLIFADYLISKGNNEKAEAIYLDALAYLSNEKDVNKKNFLKVYRFLINQKKYADALNVIRQMHQYFPEDNTINQIIDNLRQKTRHLDQ
ncbi:MAG: hypothetical protein AVO38_03510 [delta proteobacterium ML8_D]|nr:MAG: hypothetical protein AVO38_03510 [delta proteobacterium ML8_D]